LTTLEALNDAFACFASISVSQAFEFLRSQPEHMHQHLLEKLIDFVHSKASGEVRANRGVELINLPLTAQEEEWFEEYLTHGQGKSMNGARDTLMMRRIGTGSFEQALATGGKTGKKFESSKLEGVNWEGLKSGLRKGLGPRPNE
jgi:hypothetical protein